MIHILKENSIVCVAFIVIFNVRHINKGARIAASQIGELSSTIGGEYASCTGGYIWFLLRLTLQIFKHELLIYVFLISCLFLCP